MVMALGWTTLDRRTRERWACLMFHVDVPGIGVSVCIAIGVAFGAGPALTALQCAFDLFVPPLTV